MFISRMKQLTAVVLDNDRDLVTEELLRQGVLHFVTVQGVEPIHSTGKRDDNREITPETIDDLKRQIEYFLTQIDIDPAVIPDGLTLNNRKSLDIDAVKKYIDKTYAQINKTREQQKRIQQEILKLEDIRRQLNLFGDLGSVVRAESPHSFLTTQTGSVPVSRYNALSDALSEMPTVQFEFNREENRVNCLVISIKKDLSRINKILDSNSWIDIELSKEIRNSDIDLDADLNNKITGYVREQEDLKNRIVDAIHSKKDVLLEYWANLEMNTLLLRIQGHFLGTARTYLFSGWLPEKKAASLSAVIQEVTGKRCYIEWGGTRDISPGERKSIPVELKNPRILSPFQMLVKNFSIPQYGTVDPTPLVAATFVLMFGLMFGDVGHGLVLILLGIISRNKLKGKSDNIRNLTKLIIWCGGAAVISGILFGSYFGMQWFPPVWFDYHGIISGHSPDSGYVKDVFGILAITIYFGIGVISCGLVLNWVNRIIKREWMELFLDKGGILGGWIYAGGIYSAFYFVEHNFSVLPGKGVLFFLIGVPSLLFILKPPLEFIARKEKFKPFHIVNFLMEWIVEMLEIFTGFLANSLSFMRVAGLGIGHVGLMIAFFEIARVAGGGSLATIQSVLVLVAGNVLVIGLEGLSAGIQSLRLNYYEFFSKFFKGDGTAYAPISLHGKRKDIK